MTMIFSVASYSLITVTVDSAVTQESGEERSYTKGRKAYCFPGVGCVATWGSRDGNHVDRFLDSQKIQPDTHSVSDLADLVYQYLTQEYKPDEYGLGEVGYHVAGFDRDHTSRLYHIFWGFDQPRPSSQTEPKYTKYDHSPDVHTMLLYNGRNDLAQTVVNSLIAEINAGKDTRFDINLEIDHALFGDFVARFASEISPEVGPPFYTFLVSTKNEIEMVKNETWCPIPRKVVNEKLLKFGLGFKM